MEEFSSYSLEVLLAEPSRLKQSISLLKNQFDESMTSNYDFFIKTCENASKITDDLEESTANITNLSSDLAKTIELCDNLCVVGKNFVSDNKKINSGFRHLPQITDIFTIPQLMRTCKISQYYEEALLLYQSIESFARQYTGIPSIQGILEEAQLVKSDVAKTLLDSFNGNLKISDAIRAVNLLRTAKMHSETEIRLAFINGRRKALHQQIEVIPQASPMYYINELTKCYRNSFVEICNWYRALFPEDDSEDDLTLHMALHFDINEYCRTLTNALDQIKDLNDAVMIMEEAIYFGSSIGKSGFEFCYLLDSAFYKSKWGSKTI